MPDVVPEDGEQAGKPPQFVPPHVTFATAVAGAVPEGHILGEIAGCRTDRNSAKTSVRWL